MLRAFARSVVPRPQRGTWRRCRRFEGNKGSELRIRQRQSRTRNEDGGAGQFSGAVGGIRRGLSMTFGKAITSAIDSAPSGSINSLSKTQCIAAAGWNAFLQSEQEALVDRVCRPPSVDACLSIVSSRRLCSAASTNSPKPLQSSRPWAYASKRSAYCGSSGMRRAGEAMRAGQ